MKRINFILALLLLAIGTIRANHEDYTLPLGNYEDIVENGDGSGVYNESWWMVSPTQYYAKHSGSQIIYTKEQIAEMAGKEIKGISFVYYNLGAFSSYPRIVNVWVKEIGDNTFAYQSEKKSYCYFEYSDAVKTTTDLTLDEDFLTTYCLNGELTVNFDKPFVYSGTNNLLVTITFDGNDVSDSPSDIGFYYNEKAGNLAMTACSDNITFADFNESEDWPYATTNGSSLFHGAQLLQPLTKFTYQESTTPVKKPAELSGIVKSDTNFIANATVTLMADETKYEATTDSMGKFTINIDTANLNHLYTLTVAADGYEDYTAPEQLTFSSDERKVIDINLTKKNIPSIVYGKILSSEGNTPVEGAVITIENGDNVYSDISDSLGEYSINVLKSKETYTLTATAEDFERYSISGFTLIPGENKEQNITLKKIEHPSNLKGKVTCEGSPVECAEVKLTATDDKYLTYKATTDEQGEYVIHVVKSEKTYTLTVTSGECEDYVEESLTFTPGEDTIKNITLTKTPEPENTVTLGKYTKFLKEGTDKDLYYGHGYSWAAAPTNFSHKNTGSQILYTKEQLAKMSGKAITQINYIFHNESAYEIYPRTVNVWVKEVDDEAFELDSKANAYKFFEFDDATEVITNYEYAGELYEYAGENGELELVFNKPLNYSGEKNLLVTLTFEGVNCCNSLEFNFYCNNDVKNKAMTYFNDYYTFGEYAETEDWPYVNDDCVDELEQPVTRFYYTDAVVDSINSITPYAKSTDADLNTYNLAGQRVGKSYKGIVVIGGKKYVNK